MSRLASTILSAGLYYAPDGRKPTSKMHLFRTTRKRGMAMQFLRTLVLPLIMLIPPASAGAGDDYKIRIGGSGGALGAMKIIAAAFKKTHPRADVVVLPSLGSGGGIKAAIAGSLDVGLSSRPLKDTERAQGEIGRAARRGRV